jgi:hypothetical protein
MRLLLVPAHPSAQIVHSNLVLTACGSTHAWRHTRSINLVAQSADHKGQPLATKVPFSELLRRKTAFMQQVISDSTLTGVQSHRPNPAADVVEAGSRFRAPGRISPLAVCRESFVMFGMHSGPILVTAVIGFAVVSAVAQACRLLPSVSLDLHPELSFVWIALGLPLYTLAQGAIAWMGLHGMGSHVAVSLREAVRVALSRWRALLAGSLLHAGLTFLCALGLTPLMVSSDLWLVSRDLVSPNPSHVTRLVASQGVDAAALGPLHPLAELLVPMRESLERRILQPQGLSPSDADRAELTTRLSLGGATERQLLRQRLVNLNTRDGPSADAPQHLAALPSIVIALLSLALLSLTDLLLHFRTAAALQIVPSADPAKAGIFGPLIESAQLGWHAFLPVMMSSWALRLTVNAVSIVGILLPVAAADNIVWPQLSRAIGVAWLGLACRLVCAVGGAAVSAILAAFCTLFDAQLFVALQRSKRDNQAPGASIPAAVDRWLD